VVKKEMPLSPVILREGAETRFSRAIKGKGRGKRKAGGREKGAADVGG